MVEKACSSELGLVFESGSVETMLGDQRLVKKVDGRGMVPDQRVEKKRAMKLR